MDLDEYNYGASRESFSQRTNWLTGDLLHITTPSTGLVICSHVDDTFEPFGLAENFAKFFIALHAASFERMPGIDNEGDVAADLGMTVSS